MVILPWALRALLLAFAGLVAACAPPPDDAVPRPARFEAAPGPAAAAVADDALAIYPAAPDDPPSASDPPPLVDDDLDGLDDREEDELALAYRPYLSKDPDDGCPLSGLLTRVSPHPYDDRMLHIVYDHLWERDCGLGAHVGDNEVFALTVDPRLPPPDGVLALKAITHQDTPCQKVTSCGRCPGMTACQVALTAQGPRPIVFASRDKHANYAAKSECGLFSCFDSCDLGPPADVPMINVGEPDAPLVRDLTTAGLITEANGWTESELFHFDPWDPDVTFGTAGIVADDLVDPAFETPTCAGLAP